MVNSTIRPVIDFQGAVRVLATRPGSVADRLAHAYEAHLRGAAFGRLPAPFSAQCESVREELKRFLESGTADEARAAELAAKVLLTYDLLIKTFFA
ncbi:hypothetical protein SVA_3715 [Sulfurifustis variabilis]|uniref:Uncharacterized protein n=1 Tax=Sulfurifustis variabilis TaxID=1675686 RepID=A0A1B4V9K2_9GAMM|nr:hypothetical protein SVA_3715 [Sulfurifustis variabilis]